MTDPIADMITRIRNANLVKHKEVMIPFSKIKFSIAEILVKEGFIKNIEKLEEDRGQIKIELKYKKGTPIINEIKRVSKPGNRVYRGYREIPKLLPSLGLAILSTPKGVMTHEEAKKQKLGGEIIFEIN